MFTIRIDIAYIYVVSYWPSRDVKVITFPNHTFFFINRYIPVLLKYFLQLKFFYKFYITFMRVVRSGVYHIHFGPVHPGLVFFSDLQKSWGGECDGMHSCTSCTPGPGPQYLVYTYVDMVTCARYRSCRVITYDWAGKARHRVLCAATRVQLWIRACREM